MAVRVFRRLPFCWIIINLLAFASIILSINAQAAMENGMIAATDPASGKTVWLDDNRQPALFSQDFGDCLGGSLLDITRFDTAYYQDNMTISFRLEGSSLISNESLMLYISVYAYGLNRYQLVFDPCGANIFSLCPTNVSQPVFANFPISVSPTDVAAIPPLALSIPDFEGQSILRIFSNATQSEIGCYAARITNGNSFAQPEAVGSILGIFTLVAVLASFATAAYGTHLPTMRTHYAHSLSVFVVFAVWHHIFFTGALSMNWPSVLPAFWSNYAWSAGMIYTTAMQNSIHSLIGSTMGNPTAVGGAAKLGASSDSTGGGYQISSVYKRAGARVFGRTPMKFLDLLKSLAESASDSTLAKRSDLPNTTTGFDWYGTPVPQGLPLPGNFSGFAGTLSDENLPASNAFMTGFLWFLILVAMVAGLVVFFKLVVEGLVKAKVIPEDRLDFFREHWLTYTVMAVLRTLYIGFFMIIFLALFQFVYKGPAGVTAIATVVFLLAFLGIITLAGLACYSRLRLGTFAVVSDRIHLEADRALGFFPYLTMRRESSRMEKFRARNSLGSFPWRRITSTNRDADRLAAHEDEEFMMTYSWLSARYRKSRWWFFSIWLCYEFVRACFYGGAAGYPMVQVFGLLAVEFIALIAIIRARPFEGARLNLIMVYLLGFSKVATLALSSAFDAAFGLDRIVTAVIGIVIIVIQGLLTIILLIAIVVGAVTSYMSLTRNRETFAPKSWASRRMRYFAHIERAATDRPRTPPPPPAPEEPKAPYFTVASIRRLPKIEDEDEDVANVRSNRDSRSSTDHPQRSGTASPLQHTGPPPTRHSRAASIWSDPSTTNLPFGARPHRASWSSRDFASYDAAARDSMHSRSGTLDFWADAGATASRDGYGVTPTRSRAPSRANSIPLEVAKMRLEKMGEEDEKEKGKGKESDNLLG